MPREDSVRGRVILRWEKPGRPNWGLPIRGANPGTPYLIQREKTVLIGVNPCRKNLRVFRAPFHPAQGLLRGEEF